jgi:NarL family two-component system response regulator LiaR
VQSLDALTSARVQKPSHHLRLSEAPVRAVVVDDHDLFRTGLRGLLEDQGIAVVGEAADGAEGVRLALHAKPDVVVMDLNMPVMNGIEATRRLIAEQPDAKVLVLTINEDDESAFDAIAAGAVGFLVKDASITEIADGVRAAAEGRSHLSPRVAGGLVKRLRDTQRTAADGEVDLSERELEVLRLLAEGKDNAEIAAELVVSVGTVKTHVSSVLSKLGLENRIQAAVYAARRGLV